MNGAEVVALAGDLDIAWDKTYLPVDLWADEFTLVSTAAPSAFPTVEGTAGILSDVANNTNHVVPYPTGVSGGIQAGDLLLVFFGLDLGATSVTSWGGFTQLDYQDVATGTSSGGCAYLWASGGESGTFTVTTVGSERATAICICVRGADTGQTPVISSAVTGNSTNPDPPSLTPGWTDKTLWLAFAVSDVSAAPTAGPAGYSNFTVTSGTSAAFVAIATNANQVATEDPGAFTMATEQWAAWTIAVKPAAGGASGTVNLGQVSEADTAQPLSRLKSKLLGQLIETDTAQPVTRRKSRTFTEPSTSGTLFTVGKSKLKTINQLTEADTAQTVSKRKSKILGLVTESDSAQPITRGAAGLGSIVETDTAFVLSKKKSKAIAQLSEIETLFSVTPVHVAPPAVTSRFLGLITEVDSFPPEPAGLRRIKSKAIGFLVETDTVFSPTRRELRTIGLVTSTSTLFPIVVKTRLSHVIGPLVEIDTAQGMFIQRGPLLVPRPRYHIGRVGVNVVRRAGR